MGERERARERGREGERDESVFIFLPSHLVVCRAFSRTVAFAEKESFSLEKMSFLAVVLPQLFPCTKISEQLKLSVQ
jgi:hypothetical protein